MEDPLTEPAPAEPAPSSPAAEASVDEMGGAKRLSKGDAIYSLESPVRCPQCGEVLSELRAVRLLRTEVNFTSMLPRRGRIVVCPHCQTIVPAELTNL